jgi:hypothetical protein
MATRRATTWSRVCSFCTGPICAAATVRWRGAETLTARRARSYRLLPSTVRSCLRSPWMSSKRVPASEANAARKESDKKFVWGEGPDKVAVFEEKDREQELADVARSPATGGARSSTPASAGSPGPREYGGPRSPTPTSGPTQRWSRSTRSPDQGFVRHRPRHGGAHDPRPRQPTREGPVPEEDVPRRPRRLPAVQRARRRQRPRQPADQGRARRRRVDHHRPEGVDLRRPVQRHRRGHLPAPTPTCPSTRASPASSSTCTPRAWRCARCAR